MDASMALAKSEDVSLSDFPRISDARARAADAAAAWRIRSRATTTSTSGLILFDAKSVSHVNRGSNGWGNAREDGPCVHHLSNHRAFLGYKTHFSHQVTCFYAHIQRNGLLAAALWPQIVGRDEIVAYLFRVGPCDHIFS